MSRAKLGAFDFAALSERCVKCGKCIQVCTIHGINGDEVTSPRGFVDLLGAYGRNELKLDKNAKKIFESCFLCTNCVDICGESLPIDTAIENVRARIAEKFGIAWYKKAAFWLLGHRKALDLAAALGYVFLGCGFKMRKDTQSSMSPRFDLPLLKKERLLPAPAKKSFMNSHAELIDNGGEKTIGIFIGCMANYAYTGVGEAVLHIARALKLNVNLMKEQACCGAPAYFTGDFAAVERVAKFNIAYFEKVMPALDAIIVPEATCSAMLRVDYAHFFENEPQWKARAQKLASKIFMASEYFYKFTNLSDLLMRRGKRALAITYHDPCHARKMQGIWKEPRGLLAQNYEITEMDEPNKCCGFGGVTMQAERYELARAVGLAKARAMADLPVCVVSAECSACRMQLNNSLSLSGSQMRCVNPLELIAEALVSEENSNG